MNLHKGGIPDEKRKGQTDCGRCHAGRGAALFYLRAGPPVRVLCDGEFDHLSFVPGLSGGGAAPGARPKEEAVDRLDSRPEFLYNQF